MTFDQESTVSGKRVFYGYWMVPVAALAQICTSPGQTFAISAFRDPIRESLQLSETWIATAYMIGTFAAAFPLTLVGPLADRIGNRATMTFAVLGLCGACFYASTVASFTTLLLAFLLLRFLGQGSLSLLSSNTTAMWFRARLGRVSAVISVGMTAAFAVIPPILIWSIQQYGWRNTYVGLGVTVGLVMLPLLATIYRNRPEDVGQHLDGIDVDADSPGHDTHQTAVQVERSLTFGQAARGRSYWILSISMAAWAMIGTGLVFYLVPLGQAQGISAASTATVFTSFAVSMLLMQFIGGFLADRYSLHFLLCLGMSLLAAGTLCMLLVTETWHLHIFGWIFGAGQGTTVAINSTVWARYYGRQHLGKIRGFAWSASVAGSGSGPFLLGFAKDSTGSFQVALIGFLVLLIPLSVLALFATRPSTADAVVAASA